MKIETRKYVRSCLDGVSSAYRFTRHLVTGNGQKPEELDDKQLYDSVFRDVVTGISACTDRLDLGLIQIRPEHVLDSILGTREARDQLFTYLKEHVLPIYGIRNGFRRNTFDEQERIIDCIEHIYELILEAKTHTPEIR